MEFIFKDLIVVIVIIIIMYMYVCIHICRYHGAQKKVWDLLEMELQVTELLIMGAWKLNYSPLKEEQELSSAGSSPQPQNLTLNCYSGCGWEKDLASPQPPRNLFWENELICFTSDPLGQNLWRESHISWVLEFSTSALIFFQTNILSRLRLW